MQIHFGKLPGQPAAARPWQLKSRFPGFALQLLAPGSGSLLTARCRRGSSPPDRCSNVRLSTLLCMPEARQPGPVATSINEHYLEMTFRLAGATNALCRPGNRGPWMLVLNRAPATDNNK